MKKRKKKTTSNERWLDILAVIILVIILSLAFSDKSLFGPESSLTESKSYWIKDNHTRVKSQMRIRSTEKLVPQGIVVHETANYNAYADADWHAVFLDTVSREVSFHYVVDEHGSINTYPDTLVAWHAGKECNYKYIGIEICVHNPNMRKQILQNTVELIKQIKSKYPSIKQVIRHSDCAKTSCPAGLQNEGWNQFTHL